MWMGRNAERGREPATYPLHDMYMYPGLLLLQKGQLFITDTRTRYRTSD